MTRTWSISVCENGERRIASRYEHGETHCNDCGSKLRPFTIPDPRSAPVRLFFNHQNAYSWLVCGLISAVVVASIAWAQKPQLSVTNIALYYVGFSALTLVNRARLSTTIVERSRSRIGVEAENDIDGSERFARAMLFPGYGLVLYDAYT